MERSTLWMQMRANLLSTLSLIVALSALSYNTWRNESTEHNRSIRAAEFEMLRHLIEVQQIVDYAAQAKNQGTQSRADLTQGLNRILLIRDLASLTDAEVEKSADQLRAQWVSGSDKLAANPEVVAQLSEHIWQTRQAVLASLRSLK